MKAPPLPLPVSAGWQRHGWHRPTRHALAVVLAGFVLLLACSRQGEGDRCSTENDDNDCESGLICVPPDLLRGGSDDGVSRCCNPEGNDVSDGRCTRLIGASTTTTGTTTGGGGEAGAPGQSGASCDYNSDCAQPLVCGPQGVCQGECVEDRDCDEPLVCDNGVCVDR